MPSGTATVGAAIQDIAVRVTVKADPQCGSLGDEVVMPIFQAYTRFDPHDDVLLDRVHIIKIVSIALGISVDCVKDVTPESIGGVTASTNLAISITAVTGSVP